MTADLLDIVTLAEAKAFLEFDTDDTSQDDELQSFITAITGIVEEEIGPVVQREATSLIRPLTVVTQMPTPDWPIQSVTSGVYLDDSTDVDTSKIIANEGILLTTDGTILPSRAWTMTYVAGLVADTASVPLGIKKGALEILKLAWASQRTGEPPAFLISYRAAAWLKRYAPNLGFA